MFAVTVPCRVDTSPRSAAMCAPGLISVSRRAATAARPNLKLFRPGPAPPSEFVDQRSRRRERSKSNVRQVSFDDDQSNVETFTSAAAGPVGPTARYLVGNLRQQSEFGRLSGGKHCNWSADEAEDREAPAPFWKTHSRQLDSRRQDLEKQQP